VPVFAAAFDFEAVLLEAGEGGVELGDDDGYVGAGWDGGVRVVHEVDLGAGAFEPGEGAVGGVGDLGEAEDGEELDGAVEIGGGNLDTGVLENQGLTCGKSGEHLNGNEISPPRDDSLPTAIRVEWPRRARRRREWRTRPAAAG
jgi:hypothetical protein